jgi:acetyl-CoA C-acetyltransferase
MTAPAVAVVAAVRTPIGTFGGALKEIAAPQLAALAIGESLRRAQVAPEAVSEVLLGQVYNTALGPNPARQAARAAGLPWAVPATTVNQVCGSGLQAVLLGAQAIAAGNAEIVVAGGMENMSQVPFADLFARWGRKLGHQEKTDLLLRDGLWDCFYDCHMGDTAEQLARDYSLDRAAQDAYALRTQQRCGAALAADRFAGEIVPVPVPQRKGPPQMVAKDEHPRPDVTAAQLTALKPAFRPDGTVTAGNASGLNDGAAALVLMSAAEVARRQVTPLAWLRAGAVVGLDAMVMGLGPVFAIRRVLERQRLSLGEVDLLEVNEAFAAQVLAVGRELAWDEARVNVNGGAIALGHPLGASGARVAVTLLHELARRGAHRGVASLCIGGGMGIAALFERE